jgi:hypothetical protein
MDSGTGFAVPRRLELISAQDNSKFPGAVFAVEEQLSHPRDEPVSFHLQIY